jgi:threonine/homoserine/homoserine lactone efflux protein
VIEVLVASFLVGLTGAVSPGPMSASILGMSHRKPLLSTLGLVAGHGIVEAFIIIGIIFGLSSLPYQTEIALLGCVTIVILGVLQFMSEPEKAGARAEREDSSEGGSEEGGFIRNRPRATKSRGPDLERRSREEGGFIRNRPGETQSRESDLEQPAIRWGATARAPFVAGIVLTLSNPYWWIWWLTFGAGFLALQPAYAAFFVGHISADLVWFGILAFTASRGAEILGEKYRWVVKGSGIAMAAFGIFFAWSILAA